MAKDPIRAFRVDDALWLSALARAQQDDVSLSSVIREALRAYVGVTEEQRPPQTVPPGEARPDADDEHAVALLPLLEDSSLLARAQGIVMVRQACDPAQASVHLERAARARGLSVQALALQLVTSASEPQEAGREQGTGAETRGTNRGAPVRRQTS